MCGISCGAAAWAAIAAGQAARKRRQADRRRPARPRRTLPVDEAVPGIVVAAWSTIVQLIPVSSRTRCKFVGCRSIARAELRTRAVFFASAGASDVFRILILAASLPAAEVVLPTSESGSALRAQRLSAARAGQPDAVEYGEDMTLSLQRRSSSFVGLTSPALLATGDHHRQRTPKPVQGD